MSYTKISKSVTMWQIGKTAPVDEYCKHSNTWRNWKKGVCYSWMPSGGDEQIKKGKSWIMLHIDVNNSVCRMYNIIFRNLSALNAEVRKQRQARSINLQPFSPPYDVKRRKALIKTVYALLWTLIWTTYIAQKRAAKPRDHGHVLCIRNRAVLLVISLFYV